MDDFLKSLEKETRFVEEVFYAEVSRELKKIWSEIVTDYVYNAYDPKEYDQYNNYERNYFLRDRFIVRVADGVIYAHVEDTPLYWNFKSQPSRDVSLEYITHWISHGHDHPNAPTDNYDMLHHYPPRRILEHFYERVKSEFEGFDVILVEDELPLI